VRSLSAAAILRQAGFPEALSLAGGIDLWSRIVDPSVPRY
jgi:rhodanese-related sulfurtransferase